MPIKPRVSCDFQPFKTRVFSAARPVAQNIAEMTKSRILAQQEFVIHIYYDLAFLILISKLRQKYRILRI
jgi:hypothetical protein